MLFVFLKGGNTAFVKLEDLASQPPTLYEKIHGQHCAVDSWLRCLDLTQSVMPQRALCIYASVLSIGVYVCFSCNELCIRLMRVFVTRKKKGEG